MGRSLAALATLVIFGGLGLGLQAQETVPMLEEQERPIRISGVGIRVSDLERSMKFYTEVLGLKVGARVPAPDRVRQSRSTT
jgi:hypothetical protein